MTRSAVLLACSAFAALACTPARAQLAGTSQDAEGAAITAAAEYFLDRSESESGGSPDDMVVDRAFLRAGSDTVPELLPAGLAEAIAARHGLRVGSLNDYLSCDREALPPVCFLEDAEAVITFGRPALDGDSGTIQVRRFNRASAGPDPPQAYPSSAVLRLDRVDGTWQVTGVEMISVSD